MNPGRFATQIGSETLQNVCSPPSHVLHPQGKKNTAHCTTRQTLEENQLLIEATVESQNQGKLDDCAQYLQLLHQNLLFLAAVGDCLPPPPEPVRAPPPSHL